MLQILLGRPAGKAEIMYAFSRTLPDCEHRAIWSTWMRPASGEGRLRIEKRDPATIVVNPRLGSDTIIALTKFVLEWSHELDHKLYENYLLELLVSRSQNKMLWLSFVYLLSNLNLRKALGNFIFIGQSNNWLVCLAVLKAYHGSSCSYRKGSNWLKAQANLGFHWRFVNLGECMPLHDV